MRRKYGNIKVTIDGIKFDSKLEAKRYSELKILAKAGLIQDLQLQVRFELVPKQKGKIRNEQALSYIADFVYFESGAKVVEDAKGVREPLYVAKRKLMMFVHGIEIVEIGK